MKTKIDMAHDYAIEMLKRGDPERSIAFDAWTLADAMQAEADKRKVGGVPDALLTKDENGNCTHFHTTFGRGECFDCGKNLKEEWRPDWSQAPDGYNRFVIGSDHGIGFFTDIEPELIDQEYFYVGHNAKVVENHNYQGDWKDSLRKRP